MLYRNIEIDELISEKEAKREIVDLMENNGSHLKLVMLKKNEELEPHMSHSDTCIYLTEGEIELIFNLEDNCVCQACGCEIQEMEDDKKRKYKLKKGQLFFFQKDVMHSVKANKDSTFLLIKI